MKNLLPLSVFSVAFGFLEAAVVVYLRKIYYPDGFSFPLNPFIEANILQVELIREITTIVMLVCVGIVAGRSFIERLCYFMFCFGVWDIFYYVGLKIFLNWPESLLSWDLLFLIPVAWVGPVVAPIVCSFTMIFISVSVIFLKQKYDILVKGTLFEWLLAIVGVLIIYFTFTFDFKKIIISGGFINKFFTLAYDEEFIKVITNYTPKKFLWLPFIIGEVLILASFLKAYLRTIKKS